MRNLGNTFLSVVGLLLVAPLLMAPSCVTNGDRDVDNDADGYTENEFDCDDGDPNIQKQTIYNETTGTSYTNMTSASSALSDGDVLHVCGLFSDSLIIDGLSNITVYGYGLSMVNGSSESGIMIENGANIIIDGLGSWGNTAGSSTDYHGAGVWIKDSTGIEISSMNIVGNTASSHGGGIYFNPDNTTGGTITLTDVIIVNNASGDHGDAGYFRDATELAVVDSRIEDALYLRDVDYGVDLVATFTDTYLGNTDGYGIDVNLHSGLTYDYDSVVSITCDGNTNTCY